MRLFDVLTNIGCCMLDAGGWPVHNRQAKGKKENKKTLWPFVRRLYSFHCQDAGTPQWRLESDRSSLLSWFIVHHGHNSPGGGHDEQPTDSTGTFKNSIAMSIAAAYKSDGYFYT